MDRTKEFLSIVQLTEIPQHNLEPIDFYSNIHQLKKQIDELFLQISKVTSYESFRTAPLINTCAQLLDNLKFVKINENVTRDHLEVVQNLKSLVNTTYLKYQLKLNEIKRKMNNGIKEKKKESAVIQDETKEQLFNRGQEKDIMLIEQERDHQDNEQIQERKRIMHSITEIGQIVEDISIHVRLQEEQLKRIDDIVIKSDKWLKKTTSELLDYWDMVRSGRRRIIKYFSFFAIVVFLFWLIRKV